MSKIRVSVVAIAISVCAACGADSPKSDAKKDAAPAGAAKAADAAAIQKYDMKGKILVVDKPGKQLTVDHERRVKTDHGRGTDAHGMLIKRSVPATHDDPARRLITEAHAWRPIVLVRVDGGSLIPAAILCTHDSSAVGRREVRDAGAIAGVRRPRQEPE